MAVNAAGFNRGGQCGRSTLDMLQEGPVERQRVPHLPAAGTHVMMRRL